MGLLVPFTDASFSSTSSYISASPFVIAIVNSGTRVLPDIFNAVILTTILSAGNSNVYIGSRLLYALGSAGIGPKFLTRTTASGVPFIGVIITALVGLLGFLSVSEGSKLPLTGSSTFLPSLDSLLGVPFLFPHSIHCCFEAPQHSS